MAKQFLLSFLIVSLLSMIASSGIPSYTKEPSSAFLCKWLICGPFPNPEEAYDKLDKQKSGFYIDYLKEQGGETSLNINTGQAIPYQGRSNSWIETEAKGSSIDLAAILTKDPFVLAYAYSEIHVETDTPCFLAVGSNDGIRVWLNGEEILDCPERRGLQIDQNKVPAIFKQGRNTLLLKISQTENKWGFCCRFLPFQNNLLDAKDHLFQINPGQADKAILSFTGSESLVGKLFKKADAEVFSSYDTKKVLWKAEWTGKRETEIGVDASRYGEYQLVLTLSLSDNSCQTFTFPFSAGRRIEHSLFQGQKTSYSIVIGEKASDSEQWSAKELQHWLKEVSGADFPIRNDSEPQSDNEIILGVNRHSIHLVPNLEKEKPEPSNESFTYCNIGPSVVIWGGEARGTQYGVMTFLEKEFGCRWYTPAVSVIPKKDHYNFVDLHHTESPGIRVRNDFYYEAFDPIWAARNKVNGSMSYREQPGGVESYWSVHTFFPLVPPEEFYQQHPEYYSLIDGKRVFKRAQLCLTNPDVLRIVKERILDTIRKNPQYLIYCVSQNDWLNPCQCDACQAIAKAEESESGPIIWFVNQVAEAVEKEFPNKYIGTLAYQYTRKPCKTLRPRNNVVIRLCSIECCFAHDFEHCPENVSFVKDIEKWSAIAPHLYIWDYVVNFSHYIMPYPNFQVLQPNIQFFRKHNVIGLMEQAAYQSRGGEFAELRSYLIAKLLWNPDCDVQQAIVDFVSGYYARSGQYIHQYLNDLHNRITPDTHIHLGLTPEDKLFSDEWLEKSEALFDQAETVADNEDIRKRVEVARLPIMYLKCKRNPQKAAQDGTYRRFTEITKREGITYFAESGESHRKMFHDTMERYAKPE